MKYGHALKTPRLNVRPWTLSKTDREAMHDLQSNAQVRQYYPQRRNRSQSDEFLNKVINSSHENDLGWAAVCLEGADRPIGFSGLAKFDEGDLPFTPCVEIGWQYHPDHWGKGYATEAAAELVRHAFEDLNLKKVVAFAVPENTGSTAVMDRIGMYEVTDGVFNHPLVPATHPHLKKHVLYEITADQWRNKYGENPISGSTQ